jgi:homoserine O-acetyltransferase
MALNLRVISLIGHDGFLLEFRAMNEIIVHHLHAQLPEIYEGEPTALDGDAGDDGATAVAAGGGDAFKVTKTSVFGEAEADITAW